MKKFSYNGQIITASSKKEALHKIVAKKENSFDKIFEYLKSKLGKD